MNKPAFILAAVLCLAILLVSAVLVMAADEVDLSWNVIGGGGGRVQAGSVILQGTIGQPVAGTVNTGSLDLCSGYWCLPPSSQIYLPAVMR